MGRLKRFAGIGLLALLCAGGAAADSLNVQGGVVDGDSNPIADAVVTVSFGMGSGGTQVADTTAADGTYDINTEFGGGGGGIIQIAATAEGFAIGTDVATVAEPSDGVADTVVADFQLTAGAPPTGDSLYVSGTVEDVDANPLEGATVTVSILTMTGTLSASATSGADGSYEVAMLNENASANAVVEASADGFASEQVQVQIGDASDGSPDLLTRDFALDAIVYDTLTITGKAIDSVTTDPIEGALLIVSFWVGGFSGEQVRDSATAGADGSFMLEMEVADLPNEVNWSIEAAAYVGESGRDAPVEGVLELGNKDLAPFAEGDSLAYTVLGFVLDESGSGVRNTRVAVVLVGVSDTILIDTATTNNRGKYEVTSELVAYEAGDLSVTVMVEVDGYDAFSETVTASSSTADIVVDAQMALATAVVSPARRSIIAQNAPVRIYSVDGRLLAVFEHGMDAVSLRELATRFGRKSLVVRGLAGSSTQTRLVVPVR